MIPQAYLPAAHPASGRFQGAWRFVFAVLASQLAAFAADPVKSFDLPADRAEVSLKRLATQSGAQLVFTSAVAEGVRTNSVKGDFTTLDAANRLVAGTVLYVARDEKSGVISIGRISESEKNGPRAAQTTASDRPTRQNAATERTRADEVQRRDGTATRSSDDAEAVVLSPFVVSSERDTGYQATNTLAGTRLNTPIEDVGAAISVYTKDFLNDIGATSANELLVYAEGMEAAGSQGNFSGAYPSVSFNEPLLNEEQRVEPQTQVRTRGLAAPSITRGLFLTDIRFDSYNTDRVTVNRGPNAILFGVGNPAGVVDTTFLSPNLSRNLNKVELRYGSHDSLRSVLDINRVLIKDKLAARVAALYNREEYNQRPAFAEDKRTYGALTFEPYKSTTLRANFETGRFRGNRPMTITPINGYAEWDRAGRVPFDWTFYDDPARNPNAQATDANSQIGFLIGAVDQVGSANQLNFAFSNPNSSSNVPDLAFPSRFIHTSGTTANQVRTGTFNAEINRDLGVDDPRFYGTHYNTGIPAAWWNDVPGGRPLGIKRQGFIDYNVFDWRNRMIDESSRQNESFHAFNIALEQRIWKDRLGIELAYDRQRNDRRAKNSFFARGNNSNIRIDPNVRLVTGELNPNLGRPYIATNDLQWTSNRSEREGMRATAYLNYDFKDLSRSWGKWLGRHVVTGLYEENAANTMRPVTRLATDGPAAQALNADITSSARRGAVIVYMGPSVVGNNNPVRLESIRIPELTVGPTTSMPMFVRAAGTTDPGHFELTPVTFVEVLNSGTAQREVIKSQAFALQSYWLQDHLVTLFGWRRDEDYFQQVQLLTANNATRANSNDPGQVHFGFDDFGFADTPPIIDQGEITSYSAVLKWPKRLIKLPAGADLSVFINDSKNFTPMGESVDPFNQPLNSPRGKTREYGFNLSAFDRKLTLRVNRFETSITGQPTAGQLRPLSHTHTIQVLASWATQENTNPGAVPFMNAARDKILAALPSDYLALRNFTVTGTAPNKSVTFNELAVTDSTDFDAKGIEAAIVYNPTRDWRIMANVAKQETVQSNVIAISQAFYNRMLPVWNGTVTDPVSGTVVNMRDIPRAGYPEGTGPANPPNNVTTFGDALFETEVFYFRQLASEGVVSTEQRKWRANLVTNYAFDRDAFGGKLNGWSVGGAVRWQSKAALGYPLSIDEIGVIHFDFANSWYGPPETNVDAWIGYKRKIWNGRIEWKVRLNVRNLFGGNGLKAIAVQPNTGEVSAVRTPPEKRWYITNTFSF